MTALPLRGRVRQVRTYPASMSGWAAVRAGALDAAFVRALDDAPGLELLPAWPDRLVVALPAAHPLAAKPVSELADLAGLPLRI